jgi:hypothetical protein
MKASISRISGAVMRTEDRLVGRHQNLVERMADREREALARAASAAMDA